MAQHLCPGPHPALPAPRPPHSPLSRAILQWQRCCWHLMTPLVLSQAPELLGNTPPGQPRPSTLAIWPLQRAKHKPPRQHRAPRAPKPPQKEQLGWHKGVPGLHRELRTRLGPAVRLPAPTAAASRSLWAEALGHAFPPVHAAHALLPFQALLENYTAALHPETCDGPA